MSRINLRRGGHRFCLLMQMELIMGLLDGKTALVTGGASGIGLPTAQRRAAKSAHVFLTGRTQQTIDDAVASIGDAATGVRSDITEQADLETLAEAIRARGRGLDILFANAGGGEFASLQDETPEHLADTFNRNVGGTVLRSRRCCRCSTRARRLCWQARPPRPGHAGVRCLCGVESRHQVIRAHLGGRTRGPPDQGEHCCPRAG